MLQGIRVLDLSRVIAGPYSAALLGDLGADVIKVERPGRGDDMRSFRGDGQMSAAFAAVNRNKRGIAVDLQQPEGARLVFELARRADVVVENFLPGVAERLGLGYPAIRAVNPAVVYASVTGFGQTGPLARKPGYNTIAQGMSGLMALTGMPGHPPTRVGGSVSDVAASYMAFGMVNAALVHRFRTGEGQHVDVSLVSASLGLLPDPVAVYFDTGERPVRVGNRNLNLSPAEAFQAGDGFVNVVLMNPDQWAASAPRSAMPPWRPTRASPPTPRGSRTIPPSRRGWRPSSAPAPPRSGSRAWKRPASRRGRSTSSTRCSRIRRCVTSGSSPRWSSPARAR